MVITPELIRRLLIGLALVVLAYLILVPPLWPAPTATAAVPSRAPIDRDLTFPVVVSACHNNVELVEVRFFVNYEGCTGTTDVPLYPLMLVQQPRRQFWTLGQINYLTGPYSRRADVTVPLGDLLREGKIQPGVLRGKVDITLAYPRLGRYQRLPGYGYPANTRRIAVPFALTLE